MRAGSLGRTPADANAVIHPARLIESFTGAALPLDLIMIKTDARLAGRE
jgi:hypothetical protein